MRALLAVFAIVAMLAGLAPEIAQAARLSGARSMGVQRPVAPPAQKVAPAPQSAQAATPATPAAAPQPAQGNRWLGPLAGLAAGLGLGWLLSQGGFGGMLAMIVMALLAGLVVFALVRMLARPRGERSPLQYAATGQETVAAPPPAQMPLGGAPAPSAAAAPASAPALPAGFDAAGFVRQAKLNFIRLQEANDRHDLEALKEVTTEEMFAAILAELTPRDGAQQTDVVALDASLLEVTTEAEKHWASVRFTGTIRENGSNAAPFDEIWHLQKPVSGESGWLLAGIQQVA